MIQATKEKKHRKVVTFLISSVLGIVLVEVGGPELRGSYSAAMQALDRPPCNSVFTSWYFYRGCR